MTLRSYIKKGIALLLMTAAVFLAITPSVAKASSTYDNNFTSTSSLTVGATAFNASCENKDITNNWASYILDSSKWKAGTDFSAARSSLLAAFADGANGQWGVSQFTVTGDSTHGDGYSKYVVVFWSQDDNAQLDWDSHGSDDGWFPSASVFYSGTSVNEAVIRCSDDYWNDGGDQPVVVDAALNQASAGDIAAKQNQICGWQAGHAVMWCSVSNAFLYNVDQNRPAGYAGETILTGSAVVPVTGNVQCANTNNIISAIHIDAQTGMDGNATITDDGAGGKNYSYYLSEESPYSLVVLCDGDSFYGPTVNTNLYDHYDWVCTPTTPGQDPNLNICASS